MVDDPSFLVEDDDRLRRILLDARTIAVVGLSSDPTRPSHDVASYLQTCGYRVVPVNPNETEVLGEKAVPTLLQVEGVIDVVCVFRRSGEVAGHLDEVLSVAPRVLWLQDGVIDVSSARRAHAAGLEVVMDRCMLRDHARLIGGRR
jgi:predicted CoA-binding protein